MEYKENQKWENNHQNVSITPERSYETWPDGTDFITRWKSGRDILKGILLDAEKENKSVRAFGGTWSLSTVAITKDYLVDTKQLKSIKTKFDNTAFQPGEDGSSYFLAQCGVSIMEINQTLKDIGRALPTTGASDGQTIVGAISTGTHGAAVKFGSTQDNIYGLHLITSSQEDYWIEGKNKILTDEYLESLIPGIKRINDDDIFQSAIVSFGSFGIIHGVLAKHVPIYYLGIHQKKMKWEDVKGCLNGPSNIEALGFPPDPYHFEVVVNPYSLQNVIVIAMYNPADSNAPILPHSPEKPGLSPDITLAIKKVAGVIPSHIPAAMKILQNTVNNLYPDYNGEKQYPGSIFTTGVGADTSGPGLSTELGIDAFITESAADIILKVAEEVPFMGFVSFRFVKKSKATLAFTKFDVSCAIEFPSVFSKQTQRFFDRLWDTLEINKIAFTFHWGQCNNLNKDRVIDKWGKDRVECWIKARNKVLTTASQREMFSNDFLNVCGLNENISPNDTILIP